MTYLYTALGVGGVSALILFGWVMFRAGRNAARVAAEKQTIAEANSQNAAISRIAQSEADAPQTDAELFAKMDAGKEGQ